LKANQSVNFIVEMFSPIEKKKIGKQNETVKNAATLP
jgi:hypothetical protein